MDEDSEKQQNQDSGRFRTKPRRDSASQMAVRGFQELMDPAAQRDFVSSFLPLSSTSGLNLSIRCSTKSGNMR